MPKPRLALVAALCAAASAAHAAGGGYRLADGEKALVRTAITERLSNYSRINSDKSNLRWQDVPPHPHWDGVLLYCIDVENLADDAGALLPPYPVMVVAETQNGTISKVETVYLPDSAGAFLALASACRGFGYEVTLPGEPEQK